MGYAETLRLLRERRVTWNAALEMRDLPESELDGGAVRDYLREAPVEIGEARDEVGRWTEIRSRP